MTNREVRILAAFLILTLIPFSAYAQRRKKEEANKINYRSIETIAIDRHELDKAQKLCLDVVSSIDERAVDTTQVREAPKYWIKGVKMQSGLSQVSLTNWAEGGAASISLNAHIDANANYAKDKMIFENRIRMSYGFIQSFDSEKALKEQFSKSEDKLQLDSKWGWMLLDKLYFSSTLNFRTQFSPTYDNYSEDRKIQSSFLSPGYFSLGVGINYRPFGFLSLNLSPATGNLVIVTIPELRETYGNQAGQVVRGEFGAQFKMDIKYAFKGFKISSDLTLFSDYLNNPQNIQVYWDVDTSLELSKLLTLSLRTNLIYDDNIKIPDRDGNNAHARVQFKEVFSLGITYTIGQYVKPE